MTVTLGDILHIMALLVATGGLIWRMSALASDVRALQKAIEKADPHVANMPLLTAAVSRHEEEIRTLRDRSHKQGGHLQWVLTVLDEREYGRPPSSPDLDVDFTKKR